MRLGISLPETLFLQNWFKFLVLVLVSSKIFSNKNFLIVPPAPMKMNAKASDTGARQVFLAFDTKLGKKTPI